MALRKFQTAKDNHTKYSRTADQIKNGFVMKKAPLELHEKVKFKVGEEYSVRQWEGEAEKGRQEGNMWETTFQRFRSPTEYADILENHLPKDCSAEERKSYLAGIGAFLNENDEYAPPHEGFELTVKDTATSYGGGIRHCCEICRRWKAPPAHKLNLTQMYPQNECFYGTPPNTRWCDRSPKYLVGAEVRMWEGTWRQGWNAKQYVCAECNTFNDWRKRMKWVRKELCLVVRKGRRSAIAPKHDSSNYEDANYSHLWGVCVSIPQPVRLFHTRWRMAWVDWSDERLFHWNNKNYTMEFVKDDKGVDVINTVFENWQSFMYQGGDLGIVSEFRKRNWEGGEHSNNARAMGQYWMGDPAEHTKQPITLYEIKGKPCASNADYKKAIKIIELAFWNTRTPLGIAMFNKRLVKDGLDEHIV